MTADSGRSQATAARRRPKVDLEAILACRPAVDSIAEMTPVFSSRAVSEACGGRVVLKAENLQRTGSFKIRGAAAKLAALGAEARGGIVVASAGNHGQAAAFAARAAGVACEVLMPADASIAKAEAAAAYGATVRLGGATVDDCLEAAVALAASSGRCLVHPFDDADVVSGQGTLGLEIFEQVDDASTVVVPVGGGGLVAGVAVALAGLSSSVRVVGVQAAASPGFAESLAASAPRSVAPSPTLADGIAVKRPGRVTWPIVSRLVDEVVTVEEEEIASAMVLLLERAKLVVEGAGAVGVAALLSGKLAPARKGTTVVVLSGGNVDTGLLAPVIRRHETLAGRRIVLFARVSDRPGNLARLLTSIGSTGANLVAVEHLREGYDLHVRETAVHLVLETRDRDHAGAVLKATRAAGFDVQPVTRPPG